MTATGVVPTGMVSVTAFVAPLITETELELALAT